MKTSVRDIYDYLNNFEFKQAHLGYGYAAEVIDYCLQNPDAMRNIVETYGIVAKKSNATPLSVERCIRHAISRSTAEGITNKEFLATAVHDLQI